MTDLRHAWVEVDRGAVEHNVRALRAHCGDDVSFMGVVKADGYGHGAIDVARAALAGGADRLGVATVSEALALRDAGIDAPVHLLSEPPITTLPMIAEHRLISTVTTTTFIEAASELAATTDGGLELHLKIDTGMNRIGVPVDEAARMAKLIDRTPGLVLGGVMTHLATADAPESESVAVQLGRFEDALARVRAEGVDPGIVHAANSPAALFVPRARYDMVRCGIAMYGLQPSSEVMAPVRLRPAMSVKSRVTLVKTVPAGEGVSYGHTWRADASTTIATVPLGYADGVHRLLSGRMEVLIDGTRCPQVGRVCMDQLMVRIPPGVSVFQGSECVVVGVQADGILLMEELALHAETINYELACAFGARLERVYI